MLLSDLLKSFRSTDAKQMLTPKLTLITLSFPHLSAGTAFHTHEKKLNLYLVSLQPPNYSPLSYGNPFYIHYKLFFVSSSSPFIIIIFFIKMYSTIVSLEYFKISFYLYICHCPHY